MLDEFRSTSITWDKATRRIYSPITANESDSNGRKLNIQVVNSGQVENLTGTTLHLYWETKDKAQHGLDAFTASDISKGEFEIFYTTGMLSNVGELNATLVLVDNTGKVVSDWFKITVARGIDNDAIQSENSFTTLTQALIDISNLEQNYAPRLNDLTAQLQQTAVYSGDNDDLFTPPQQTSIHSYFTSGDAFSTDNQTYNEFVELFDSLLHDNDGYVSKRDMGAVSDGVKRFSAYFYTPENYTKTVIIGSGMHGWEKVGVISLYNFLKLLTEEWEEYPQLAYIRHNVRLIVMPIQNPHGLQVNTRANANGVDINRNFDYNWNASTGDKGPSPASEKETQYIQQILNENNDDAIAYLDFHNMNIGDRDFAEVVYVPKFIQNTKLQEIERIIQDVKRKGAPDSTEIIVGADWAMGLNYASQLLSMYSMTPEFVPGIVGNAYDKNDMTYALSWFGNIIIRVATLSVKHRSVMNTQPYRYLHSQYYRNSSSAVPISQGSYGVVPQTDRTIKNYVNGFARITYHITFTTNFDSSATFNGKLVYFTPIIYQTNSTSEFKEPVIDGTSIPLYNSYFQHYKGANERDQMTVEAIIPINRFEGDLHYELQGYTTANSATVMRVTTILELIPSENSLDIRSINQ